MSDDKAAQVGKLLGLIVHDLRNPGATIGANVAYVKEVVPEGGADDLDEALSDVEMALGDLMRGLEQVSWMGRWLAGQPPAPTVDGDVGQVLSAAKSPGEQIELEVDLPGGELWARGGASLAKVVDVLLANSAQHARRGVVHLSARAEGGHITVEIKDAGKAIAPELRERAFTMEGQHELKGRADGRYGRVVGLLAAKILADSVGATLEADGEDGAAIFRIRLAGQAD